MNLKESIEELENPSISIEGYTITLARPGSMWELEKDERSLGRMNPYDGGNKELIGGYMREAGYTSERSIRNDFDKYVRTREFGERILKDYIENIGE